MPLHKIKSFDPDYRDDFGGQDILTYDLYSNNDKIGSVEDLLVDDGGRFRYFVINTGAWIFGKKVLLPVGRAQISNPDRRVYVQGLTREQVENLPEYDNLKPIDYDYEERVRNTYRPRTATTAVEQSAPVEQSAALGQTAYDRSTYDYTRDPDLYGLNERDHQTLKLYEERLVANKHRQKTGDVVVGKRVETETARVDVPLERERVVIEQVNTNDVGRPVAPGEVGFQESEVARIEVYEEVPDVHKEAYVRQQVNVRKEVEQTSATTEDEIRRERLDVKTDGHPAMDQRPDSINDERI